MLTGELKNQVEKVWSRFWSGGMANPLEIIEVQIGTYLGEDDIIRFKDKYKREKS